MKKQNLYKKFIIKNIPLITLSIIFNIASGLSKTISATYLQKITDGLEFGVHNNLVKFIITGGILAFFCYFLRWLGAIIPNFLSHKFAYDAKEKLLNHLSKIPFLKYENMSIGSNQSIIHNDTESAGFRFYIVLSRILNNIFLFIFSVVLMAKTNIKVTIIIVTIIAVATIINQFILKRVKNLEKNVQNLLGSLTSNLEKTFNSLESIKTFWAKDFALETFNNKNDLLLNEQKQVVKVDSIREIWYIFIEHFCLYGSLVFVGIMGLKGQISIGEVLMYVYLIKQIIMPIEVVFRWMSSLAKSSASYEKAQDILSIEEDVKNNNFEDIEKFNNVRVENITFSYYSDENNIISNLVCVHSANYLQS